MGVLADMIASDPRLQKARRFDPRDHPRWPEGLPIGGRFRPDGMPDAAANLAARALAELSSHKGKHRELATDFHEAAGDVTWSKDDSTAQSQAAHLIREHIVKPLKDRSSDQAEWDQAQKVENQAASVSGRRADLAIAEVAPAADTAPKVRVFRRGHPHVKAELEVIASDELAEQLASWGEWTPKQVEELRDYLRAETSGFGMLTAEQGRERGEPMGPVVRDAKILLQRLENVDTSGTVPTVAPSTTPGRLPDDVELTLHERRAIARAGRPEGLDAGSFMARHHTEKLIELGVLKRDGDVIRRTGMTVPRAPVPGPEGAPEYRLPDKALELLRETSDTPDEIQERIARAPGGRMRLTDAEADNLAGYLDSVAGAFRGMLPSERGGDASGTAAARGAAILRDRGEAAEWQPHWTRDGRGVYVLDDTQYRVAASYDEVSSDEHYARTGRDMVGRTEWAVVRGEGTGDNISWHDTMREAKEEAERHAKRERRAAEYLAEFPEGTHVEITGGPLDERGKRGVVTGRENERMERPNLLVDIGGEQYRLLPRDLTVVDEPPAPIEIPEDPEEWVEKPRLTRADLPNPDLYNRSWVEDPIRHSGYLNEDQPQTLAEMQLVASEHEAKKRDLSPEEFRAQETKLVKELTDPATAQIVTRTTRGSLMTILRQGRFKTQHENRRSNGLLDQDFRASVEEEQFGFPKDGPVELRPVYGYVTDEDEQVYRAGGFLMQYGDAVVVMKNDVRDRTTVTADDSLDQHSRQAQQPMPIDEADWRIGVYASPDENEGRGINIPVSRDFKPGEKLSSAKSFMEAQIHGGVHLEDIDHVVLGTEPEDKLKKLLDRKGVRYVVKDEGKRRATLKWIEDTNRSKSSIEEWTEKRAKLDRGEVVYGESSFDQRPRDYSKIFIETRRFVSSREGGGPSGGYVSQTKAEGLQRKKDEYDNLIKRERKALEAKTKLLREYEDLFERGKLRESTDVRSLSGPKLRAWLMELRFRKIAGEKVLHLLNEADSEASGRGPRGSEGVGYSVRGDGWRNAQKWRLEMKAVYDKLVEEGLALPAWGELNEQHSWGDGYDRVYLGLTRRAD